MFPRLSLQRFGGAPAGHPALARRGAGRDGLRRCARALERRAPRPVEVEQDEVNAMSPAAFPSTGGR